MPITAGNLNGGIDTEGVIKKLVDVERQPVLRLENEKKYLEAEKSVWGDFKKELISLDKILKDLYSFNRVFKKKKIISDNKDYFSADVQDNAEKDKHTLEIIDIAQAHKIKSDNISPEKKLPGAKITIQIGSEKSIDINFNGGSINKLADAINEKADKLVKATVIQLDNENAILTLESKITGEKNKIVLSGDKDSERLFETLGLTTSTVKKEFSFRF